MIICKACKNKNCNCSCAVCKAVRHIDDILLRLEIEKDVESIKKLSERIKV